MELITLTLILMILCFGFYALFVGSRLFGPMIRRFAVFSGELDNLQTRIIPVLALMGLLAILAKITIF